MTLPMVTCPLCCRPGFNTSDALCTALLDVASRMLCCPICTQVISGLDKFTVHLVGHSRVSPPSETTPVEDQTEIYSPSANAKSPEVSINSWPSTPSLPSESHKEFESCQELITKGDFTVDEPEQPPETLEKNTFGCDICTYAFPNKTILAMHKQLVHKRNEDKDETRKVLNCQHCPRTFSLRSSLMIHNRVAHAGGFSNADNGQPKPEHSCNICGKFFKREVHLLQHLKVHDEKQWQCTICSKKFTTKYFLKKHRRLHTGEMPYTCQTCNKSFTFQQSYHKHLLYHTNDKPYCCSKCGRLFKELSTLHNHERIHSGEKPFTCETCGKSFRQRVSYLVHKRIHTGVMPYKCTACNKSFRYKISQRTHKCPAEPPGVVLRSEGYFVHRLQALKDQNPETYSVNVLVSTDSPESPQKDKSESQSPRPCSSKDVQIEEKENPDLFESLDGDLIKMLSPTNETQNTFFDSLNDDALKELLFGSMK